MSEIKKVRRNSGPKPAQSDGFLPTSDSPEPASGVLDRTIDTERAGGTGNTASKPAIGAPEMSFAEAEEYVEAMVWWRLVPSRPEQALRAYAREIDRLRTGIDCIHESLKRVLPSME